LLKHRISISSKNIILASPIKELGTYKVGVREGDYSAEIDVVVTQA
jgi:ribosomal protein L9